MKHKELEALRDLTINELQQKARETPSRSSSISALRCVPAT